MPQLRNYQKEIINKTMGHLKNNNRGNIIMACGTGKTKTSLNIDIKMKNKLTLILVPILALIDQWFYECIQEYTNIKYILIGSDIELKNNNILATTTKSNEIEKCIYDNKNNKIIVISTYNSCDKIINTIKFDLIIFDEAHKTVQKKESFLTYSLFDKNIQSQKRIFITATPVIYEPNDKNENLDIISMNNTNIYGERIYTYDMGDGIKNKILADYEILFIDINDESVIPKLLVNMLNNKEFNHLISFHPSIEHSENFCSSIDDKIFSCHLDCNDDSTKRNKMLECFKNNKIGIVCNVHLFGVGINIPIIDAICLHTIKCGACLIQAIGRALRKKNLEDNKMAKIIVLIKEGDTQNKINIMIRNLIENDHVLRDSLQKDFSNITKKFKFFKSDKSGNIHENSVITETNKKYNIIKIGSTEIYKMEKYNLNNLLKFIDNNKRIPFGGCRDGNSEEKRLCEKFLSIIENKDENYGILASNNIVTNFLKLNKNVMFFKLTTHGDGLPMKIGSNNKYQYANCVKDFSDFNKILYKNNSRKGEFEVSYICCGCGNRTEKSGGSYDYDSFWKHISTCDKVDKFNKDEIIKLIELIKHKKENVLINDVKDINENNENVASDKENENKEFSYKIVSQKERKYQQKMKQKLMISNNAKCFFTKQQSVSNEAAHIKDFCDCNDTENQDINNYILMNPQLHSLFDKYVFAINPKSLCGEINFNACKLYEHDKKIISNYVENKFVDKLSKSIKYLEHRYKKFLEIKKLTDAKE